jgi:hypothetical protein
LGFLDILLNLALFICTALIVELVKTIFLIFNLSFLFKKIISRYFSKSSHHHHHHHHHHKQMNRSINSIETYDDVPSFSSSNASKENNAATTTAKTTTSGSSSSATSKSANNSGSNSKSSESSADLKAAAQLQQHHAESIVARQVDYVGDFLKSQQRSRESSAAAAASNNANLIAIVMDSLSDLLLETGVFVTGFKKTNQTSLVVRRAVTTTAAATSSHVTLSAGDRIVSINGVSLANQSLTNLSAKFFQTYSTFHLMIQKTCTHADKTATDQSNRSFNNMTGNEFLAPNKNNYFLAYENDQPMAVGKLLMSNRSSLAASKNSIFSEVMGHLNFGGAGGAEKEAGELPQPQQLPSAKSAPKYKYPGSKVVEPLYPKDNGFDHNHHHYPNNDLVNNENGHGSRLHSDDLIKNFQEFSRKEKHLFFERNSKEHGK